MPWWLYVGAAVIALWLIAARITMCLEFGSALRNPIALRSRERLPDDYWRNHYLLGPLITWDTISSIREQNAALGFAWPSQEWWLEARAKELLLDRA